MKNRSSIDELEPYKNPKNSSNIEPIFKKDMILESAKLHPDELVFTKNGNNQHRMSPSKPQMKEILVEECFNSNPKFDKISADDTEKI